MLRIVTHIEHLLLVHDCVIVPKFGGFVLQSIPAMYRAENHSFSPSRKEIVFNTTLQHNDGLLSESYMQMYGVDYRRAVLMLEEDTRVLKETLQQQKVISLGNIGSFSIGEEGQLIFQPSDAMLFSVSSYGLTSFCFPTLQSCLDKDKDVLSDGEQKKRKDVLYIPVSRRFIRVVAASAAAVALFLLVSTPVKDVNQNAYTASFVPAEIVSKTSGLIPSIPSVSTEASVPVPVKEKEVKEEVVATALPKIAEAPKVAPSVTPKKLFHIVIASFPTEAQANEYMAGVQGECKNVSKVVRDGKYRIYADKYDNREQAETSLAALRKNNKFKDAWLFISR